MTILDENRHRTDCMQSMRAASSITSRRSLIVVALLLVATAALRPLPAQILRGSVRDSASRAPIPGAVIVLLDSGGASLGRNITNERGDYTIALHPAMRRIQVLRIGFRPRTLRIPEAVDGIARLDVLTSVIPRLLESVSVIDQPNCPRRDGRTQAFALWEQARTALLAVVVAREANPANVTRLHAIRRIDPSGRAPTSQTVRIDSASTSRPFVASRKAEEFVQRGFSYDSGGATWYNGPDADTMLDDAFVRGYCFHVATPDTTRPKQVGLAFAPADRKRGRIDIEGTVWIDSTSLSLTDIVFRYLGMPTFVQAANPGGRVSFRSMDNGTALVDRWAIRSGGFVRTSSGRMTARQLVNAALEIQESIGEVASARWADGLAWKASLGTMRGQLDSARAGIPIRLIDTDYRAVTDSAGRFEITQLLPGPYRIGLIDPAFAEIDLIVMTHHRFIAARDSVSEVAVVAPTPWEYIASVCAEEANGANIESALVLRVEMPDGGPANNAKFEVRTLVGRNMKLIAEGKTDGNGLIQICNPPQHKQLSVRIDHGQAQPMLMTIEIVNHLKVQNVQLSPKR
jgi:hypothetical protein